MAPTYTLNDGHEIPAIGFGTYPLRATRRSASIVSAVEAGYRLLDTAVNYGNEREVGEAVRACGVPREELVVASKIPGRHHAYDDAIASTRESLATLGLDHLDLHLIHWPNPSVGKYVEAWQALVDLQKDGLVRSIGVSNFTEEHLRRIIDETGVTPAVNQVEMHPYFPQEHMRAVQRAASASAPSRGARSASGRRRSPSRRSREAAERHGVSPGQVILRWQVQNGSVPIPKSANPERQRQNIDVFSFELSDDEMAAITGLGRADGRLFGGDPDVHEEM